MDKRKWTKLEKHALSDYHVKLMEEFGEVVIQYSKIYEKMPGNDLASHSLPRMTKQDRKLLLMELEHLEFISRCFREKLNSAKIINISEKKKVTKNG
jgi:hypothetical protein